MTVRRSRSRRFISSKNMALLFLLTFSGLSHGLLAQTLSVTFMVVEIVGQPIDPIYYACGNSSYAGPFITASDAVDWKNAFAPGSNIVNYNSTDNGACTAPILALDNGTWKRQ